MNILNKSALGATILGALIALVPSVARAADDPKPDTKTEAERAQLLEKERPDGWKVTLNFGATGAFNHSSNVVGTDNGSTFQLGGLIDLLGDLIDGLHEWDNSFTVQHAETKTPQIDRFVKSLDNLDLKSTYLYHFEALPQVGPFARFKLNTQILNSYAIRPEAVTVSRQSRNGDITTADISPAQEIALTRGFEPLVLRETAGFFANPMETKRITIKTKLGMGAQEIIVRNGYVVDDNKATPILELRQLDDANELGPEAEVAMNGLLIKDLLSWKLGANAFYPIVSDAHIAGRSAGERINLDLGAGLSLNIVKWLSLDYVLTAKRVPLVLNEFQVQNGLLLTASIGIL